MEGIYKYSIKLKNRDAFITTHKENIKQFCKIFAKADINFMEENDTKKIMVFKWEDVEYIEYSYSAYLL